MSHLIPSSPNEEDCQSLPLCGKHLSSRSYPDTGMQKLHISDVQLAERLAYGDTIEGLLEIPLTSQHYRIVGLIGPLLNWASIMPRDASLSTGKIYVFPVLSNTPSPPPRFVSIHNDA